jgi:hypothetical protein
MEQLTLFPEIEVDIAAQLEKVGLVGHVEVLREHQWPTIFGWTLIFGKTKENIKNAEKILTTPVGPVRNINDRLVDHTVIKKIAKILSEESTSQCCPSRYFAECAWHLVGKMFPALPVNLLRQGYEGRGKTVEWNCHEIVSRALKLNFIRKLKKTYSPQRDTKPCTTILCYKSGQVYTGMVSGQMPFNGCSGHYQYSVIWDNPKQRGSVSTLTEGWTITPDGYKTPSWVLGDNPISKIREKGAVK